MKGKWIELFVEMAFKIIVGVIGICLFFAAFLWLVKYLLFK
jgi:hypothetical protein